MKQISMKTVKLNAPHWFSNSNMRFFDTRIHSTHLIGGSYFITSEQAELVQVSGGAIIAPYDGERRYSIRQVINHDIETVGNFMEYATLEEAESGVRSLLAESSKFVSDSSGIAFINESTKD
jgi:hypothetical protein